MTTKNVEANDSVADVAAQGAAVAPESAVAKKTASRKQSAPKEPKAAKGAKPGKRAKKGAKAAREAGSPREGSKTSKILHLMGRAKGANLADIVAATGWQPHSVRGFLSTAGKKHNVNIASEKNEGEARVYRIKK